MKVYILIALGTILLCIVLFRKRLKPYFRFLFSKLFLLNLIAALTVAGFAFWGLLVYLDNYTLHDENIAVPNFHSLHIDDIDAFAKEHNLRIITIKDLIQYRIQKERFITKIETVKLPTDMAEFNLTCYKDNINEKYHFALTLGTWKKGDPVLVRVHSECITGDVFGSQRCDCAPQLHTAMQMVADNGSGAILYMSQEGRGIGIANKLKAYKLQEEGKDTVEANESLGFKADLRDYGVGAQILLDLNIETLQLITNNPKKIVGLQGYGLQVDKRVPIEISPGKYNKDYLSTKKDKLGHLFGQQDG